MAGLEAVRATPDSGADPLGRAARAERRLVLAVLRPSSAGPCAWQHPRAARLYRRFRGGGPTPKPRRRRAVRSVRAMGLLRDGLERGDLAAQLVTAVDPAGDRSDGDFDPARRRYRAPFSPRFEDHEEGADADVRIGPDRGEVGGGRIAAFRFNRRTDARSRRPPIVRLGRGTTARNHEARRTFRAAGGAGAGCGPRCGAYWPVSLEPWYSSAACGCTGPDHLRDGPDHH